MRTWTLAIYAIVVIATTPANAEESLQKIVDQTMSTTCNNLRFAPDGADCVDDWMKFLQVAMGLELIPITAELQAIIDQVEKGQQTLTDGKKLLEDFNKIFNDRVAHYRRQPQK